MRNLSLAFALYRSPWLVDDATLAIGQQILAGNKISLDEKQEPYTIRLLSDSDASGSSKKTSGVVAVVPILGTLSKSDTWCNFGTDTISQKIINIAKSDQVAAIVLDIDSGGGCSNAIPPLLRAIDAIHAEGKIVLVHTDYCCSAAYWVASAADGIYMDNQTMSIVGSIGAFCHVVESAPGDLEKNGYRTHIIYADESPDKNKAYRAIQNGDDGPYKQDLSRLVSLFHGDIKNNRPRLNHAASGVLTGDLFYADQAIVNGIADGVMTIDEVVALAALKAELNQNNQ